MFLLKLGDIRVTFEMAQVFNKYRVLRKIFDKKTQQPLIDFKNIFDYLLLDRPNILDVLLIQGF